MNEQLQAYARATILSGLAKCTVSQAMLFKRMYAGGNLDKDITDVVADMPPEKLETAMDQMHRTLAKAERGK